MGEPKVTSIVDRFRDKLFYPMSSRWKDVTLFPPTKTQGETHYTFYIRGITMDNPPRYFLAWVYLDPKMLISGDYYSYLESKATALAAKLDDFLNPLCKCVPTPDGSIGDPCDYHQGKHRSITIQPDEPTRFPEGAEL